MANSRTNSGTSNLNVLDYLMKYGVVILVAIYVVPYMIKYFKEMMEKGKVEKVENEVALNNAQNEVQNPSIINEKANKYLRDEKHFDTVTRTRLMNNAKKLASAMGYDKAWYNPKSWVENDKEVYDILVHEVYNYKHLLWLYYNVYTKSRNLTTDVLDNLDSGYMTKLKAHYKKYKFNYF